MLITFVFRFFGLLAFLWWQLLKLRIFSFVRDYVLYFYPVTAQRDSEAWRAKKLLEEQDKSAVFFKSSKVPLTHRYVRVAGNTVNLHIAEMGDPKKPLMLFLHGFPEFWFSWRAQMLEFSRDYHVVAVDQRGYNISDILPHVADYKIDKLCRDVEDVIVATGHEKAVLVAHDWGGMVAWRFAHYFTNRVDKLVVCNIPHPMNWMGHLKSNEKQMKRSYYFYVFQIPLLDRLLPTNFFAKYIRKTLKQTSMTEEEYAFFLSAANNAPVGPKLNWYRAVFAYPDTTKLSFPLPVPTLQLHGTADTAIGKELCEGTDILVTDFTLKYVEGASHWVQQDAATVVNREMRQWLASKTSTTQQ